MDNEKNGKANLEGGEQAVMDVKAPAWVRFVRLVYGLLATIYFVCIIIQVFLAGMGVFVNSGDLALHSTFVTYFEFVPIVMFVISFFGRIRGVLRWLNLGLFALTSLQYMTVQVFSGFLPAFHTVDALLLFWASMYLMKRSSPWLLLRTEHYVSKEKLQS